MSRAYCSADALDAVYQDVVHFLHFERITQSMDEYLVEWMVDLFNRKAEFRVRPGGTSPAVLTSLLRLRNAFLPGRINRWSWPIYAVRASIVWSAGWQRVTGFAVCGAG